MWGWVAGVALALMAGMANAQSTVPQTGADAFPVSPAPQADQPLVESGGDVPKETVVAGLSSDSVAITASFDGSDILIYGAIKRETPIPSGPPLQVIVTVEAPSSGVTVWRKERKAGIWVNSEAVRIGAAPGFYAVATSGPLEDILLPDWDSRYRISLSHAMRAFAGQVAVESAVPFTEALIRIRENEGLYRLDQGTVSLIDQTLFRADVNLPANLVEGAYKTRIFLLRNGQVIDSFVAPINVRKVGLERWLYRLAFDQPLVYGLLSLGVAVFAGWGASAAFRKLRRP